ncbi:MAG: hypothetical protein K2I71_07705, partial [Helicobacter sp.]|nr:hypothetical protein [Helicobacter sp.]
FHAPNRNSNQAFTTTPSIFPQAFKEKQAQLAQKELTLQEQLKETKLKAKEREDDLNSLLKEREALSGLSANERALEIKESIPKELIPHLKASISLSDKQIIPLNFIKVKAKDLKPNFQAQSGTQTRATTNEEIIKNIAQDFNPSLIFGRGGFEDLPIILKDGQILSGNHRVKGMQDFNADSKGIYLKAIKEHYGVDLKEDELLVRTPQENLSDKELINLALASNLDRISSEGDKAIALLGKYDENIQKLPSFLEGESLEELKANIAKRLDTNNKFPSKEDTNLALLSKMAKNSNGDSIAEVLNKHQKELDPNDFEKFKTMFIDNAGSFYNLDTLARVGFTNLNIRPYLLDLINATGNGLKQTRQENFQALNEKIKHFLNTTNEKGKNALVGIVGDVYKDIIAEGLGYALSRYARLENPSNTLFLDLKNIKSDLMDLSNNLFVSKPLSQVDIYDFLEALIAKGETSDATSETISLLPKLREKEQSYHLGKDPKEGLSDTNKNLDVLQSEIKEGEVKQQSQNILKLEDNNIENFKPIKEFGENYPQFCHKGQEAIEHLLQTKSGQVQGAFYRKDLE